MKFKRMGHAALRVNNLAESLDFYRDVLGMQVRWGEDDDWGQVSLGGDDLGLVAKEKGKHPYHIGFRVEKVSDLEKTHSELKAQGVRVEAIVEHRDGCSSFYFFDPSGNALEALFDPHNS